MMIPDSRELCRHFACDIREAAILGALAYSAIHGLKSDEVSENDAYKTYGKAWMRKHLDAGMLHFARVGKGTTSTKFYSVFEIETLKRAEKHITEIYNNALIDYENNK